MDFAPVLSSNYKLVIFLVVGNSIENLVTLQTWLFPDETRSIIFIDNSSLLIVNFVYFGRIVHICINESVNIFKLVDVEQLATYLGDNGLSLQ